MRTINGFCAPCCLALVFPALPAVDGISIDFFLLLQARAEVSQSENAVGEQFNVTGNTAGQADPIDFYLRRFRPGFRGTIAEKWPFMAILQLDNTDRASSANAARSGVVQAHIAEIGREFTVEGGKHLVQIGLDYPFFNLAASRNATSLLINQRASARFLDVRGTGAGWRWTGANTRAGVDVQNVDGDDADAAPGEGGEGLLYTARGELSFGTAYPMDRWAETFWGKPGTSVTLGAEVGFNQGDRVVAERRDTLVLGTDLMFHHEAWSALAEVAWQRLSTDRDNGSSVDDVTGLVALVQAGYAKPVGAVTLEVAARFTLIDLNTDNDDEAVAFGAGAAKDFGQSGWQYEVGVNCYFKAHLNKLGIAYLHWDAEAGQGVADIVRIQHQVFF